MFYDKFCTTISHGRPRQRCPATTSLPMMCLTASASRTGLGTDSRSNTPPPQLRTFILTIVAERPASRRHKSTLTCVYHRLQEDRRHSASWPQRGFEEIASCASFFSAYLFSVDVLEADFGTTSSESA